MKRVLSVGAHPDDVEEGMAGAMLTHGMKDNDVHILLCTLGGVSGNPKEREQESLEAADILNANLHIIDYPVCKLNKLSNDFIGVIGRAIDEINPDIIYTHSPFDFHQVHITVSKAVTTAAKHVNRIILYESVSSGTPEFQPNAFVDITNYIDRKIKSVEAHKSQSKRVYMQPGVVRSLANIRYVLGKVGTNPDGMAEAFMVYRYVL